MKLLNQQGRKGQGEFHGYRAPQCNGVQRRAIQLLAVGHPIAIDCHRLEKCVEVKA